MLGAGKGLKRGVKMLLNPRGRNPDLGWHHRRAAEGPAEMHAKRPTPNVPNERAFTCISMGMSKAGRAPFFDDLVLGCCVGQT